MPTYAYACTECDHRFDLAQSFAEDPLTICPECEGRLRKVYGSIGITFKGSGFYRTDSRAAASASSGKGEAKPAKESADSSTSGKDGAASSTSSASGGKDGASSTSTSGGKDGASSSSSAGNGSASSSRSPATAATSP